MIPIQAYLSGTTMILSMIWFLVLVKRYKQTMSQAYRWPILIAAVIALTSGLTTVVLLSMNS